MRKILKIARLELSILFYSPVAWLVLAIFTIQSGITFLDSLQGTRTSLSLGYFTGPITRPLFSGNTGLFTAMQGYLYLYLPILTMGLMSRETSSGSIKLLLSSPVKLSQIIVGKYLAIIGYGLALIAVQAFYGIIGIIFISHADIGLICSGLLGLYLLICTYAAIGLFMSCLTTYQVVAAISTLAVFAMLRFVGSLWQGYDFIRDLTYFLSISGRTEKMIAGLITTKDLFYYLIIIVSFLWLCVLRLKSERELKPLSVKIGRYVLLFCCALLLGYITSRPVLTGYLDATANKSLTITKNSQAIAGQIDGELKVTTYANMLAPALWNVLPASRNADLSRLEQYKRFIPGMDVNYVYYYQKPVDSNFHDFKYNPNLKGITNVDQIAEKMATTMDVDGKMFMPPAQINKLVNLQPEGYLPVRKIEYKGKSTFLRFYLSPGESDPYAGEAEVIAAIKKLITKSPKVVFLTGNNERATDSKADRDYQLISALKIKRTALINQGFDVDTVNLATQDIPADVSIVVIADPTTPFNTIQQQKLNAYIKRGGNMMITGEPGRQQVLNPLLQTLGVQLKPGILVKPDKNLTPGFINAGAAPQSAGLDSNINRFQAAGATVAMQGAAAIEFSAVGNFKVNPLLLSTNGGFNKQVSVNAAGVTRNAANPVQRFRSSAPSNVPAQAQTVVTTKVVAGSRPAPSPRTESSKPTHTINTGVLQSINPNAGPAVTMTGGNNVNQAQAVDLTTTDLSFNSSQGDEKGVFPVMVALTRNIDGQQQRIIVSGDADFISNGELSRAKRGENLYYMFGMLRWLGNGTFPIDVTRPPAKDIDLNVSRGQITLMMWLCKGIIPALIAVMGSIILFKRRRN